LAHGLESGLGCPIGFLGYGPGQGEIGRPDVGFQPLARQVLKQKRGCDDRPYE
jgi:hypothetical protein